MGKLLASLEEVFYESPFRERTVNAPAAAVFNHYCDHRPCSFVRRSKRNR